MGTRALAFGVGITLFTAGILWSGTAAAYDTYSGTSGDANCFACHGDFGAGMYMSEVDGSAMGNLHNVHRRLMLGASVGATSGGDCATCHSAAGTTPVTINASEGGMGLAPIACVGCHGRAEDHVAGNPEFDAGRRGYGAGLRQHHYRAGQTVCADCHADANPTAYTPVGENVLPPYYAMPGTMHPAMPTLPCNPASEEDFAGSTIGIDNDGDDVWDMLDRDCLPPAAVGAACDRAAHCTSGFCADGFCCATACGGGSATDCEACSMALTGVANGTCGNVTAAAALTCRPAAGSCDVAETCAGSAATCPADAFAADATACSDGLTCNEAELCTAGACGGGMAIDCDDADDCTTDTCAEPAGCAHTAIAGCMPDAGIVDVDAGPDTDAGVVDTDAGSDTDAGPGTDGGPRVDMGMTADAGTVPPPPADDGGCGCITAGASDSRGSSAAGAGLAMLALAGLMFRRRRAR